MKKVFSFIGRMDKKYVKGLLALVTVIIGAIAIYLTFVPQTCVNFECFAREMERCSPATYVSEEFEATWNYRIRGVELNDCVIEVTLLNAKEGDLGLRELEGESMSCFYPRKTVAYPDKNLDFCHGILKENLQGIVIEKLYSYVVSNLEPLRDELIF
jgi:hypothetical protein